MEITRHTSPDSSALSILRCYCARHGSSGSLLCCSRHLLPFPHKTVAGRRLRLSKRFEQPYTRGTELGNDESRPEESRATPFIRSTAYSVRRSKHFVPDTSYEELSAGIEVLRMSSATDVSRVDDHGTSAFELKFRACQRSLVTP